MADPDLARFGRRIKRERARRGWSTRDLAAKAGLTGPNAVSRAERGNEIWLSTAVKLTAALGLSLEGVFAPASCEACDDSAPSGFTCNVCGAGNG